MRPRGKNRATTRPAGTTEKRAPAEEQPLCIVGVGASAGGLEAFTQLLTGMPADPGIALVLVQHLDPKHESILGSLLSRSTAMPVRETTDGTRLEVDHVYVIPPTVDIALEDGHIRHVPRVPRPEPHLPIDLFLRTLAEVQGSRAIAVILSGTGSDGTLGCQAVRAEGGIAFAQDPVSARFDGMPHSAIQAGGVDFVLPAGDIGREIVRLARGAYLREPPERSAGAPESANDGSDLARIFALLKKATGADFTCYRQTTLRRRIQRRMAVRRIESLADYVKLLASQPAEVQDLHRDLLINVTSFFRDPETFLKLGREVLPRILSDRNADAPVRIWVPGCATGEEAYSIAICALEAQAVAGGNIPIQVFATDLSDSAVGRARAGVYPRNIAGDVSPERLRRFFVEVDGQYHVSKAVRDLVVFARQDLTRDPPFSRMDLISCRNVLIYLEPSLQRRVMTTLHYALNSSGQLLLGQSETAGASSELFKVVDRDHKIYSKVSHAGVPLMNLPPGVLPGATRPGAPAEAARVGGRSDVEREAQRLLLGRFAPASVLVDEDERVFHFAGDTQPYLAQQQGAASFQLAKVVRKELLAELRRLLRDARVEQVSQRKDGLLVRYQGRARRFTLEVIPLKGPASGERCFLVLFDGGARQRSAAPPRGATAQRRLIAALEQELLALRHYQQAVQEEQEGANEELQSANEEIISSNEELQSINEELETAKEELQSNNEELMTLNEELQARNRQLQRLHDDLDNFMASATVPIVMLGPDLAVRRLTPAASTMLHVLPSDVGRPLGHVRTSLDSADLEDLVRGVLHTRHPDERELKDASGNWWRLQARPYRTRDDRIEGAVLVLVDIDALKRNERVIEAARDFADAIVDTAHEPLLILDSSLRVRRMNSAFADAFGLVRSEAEGELLYDLGERQWDRPVLRLLLEEVLTRDRAFEGFLLEGEFSTEGPRSLALNARKLRQEEGKEDLILLAIEDRTERNRVEAERAHLLKRAEDEARSAEAANRLKDEFVANASHELRGPLNAMVTWTHLLSHGPLDPAILARGVAAIERSAMAQTRLIEDLLDITRITLGKLRLEMRPVDVEEVVEAALESARAAAEAKGIALGVASEVERETVLGDAGRLQQVIWNLLSNAVKFTPRGGTVEVWWGRVGTFVQVKVTDNGQGIKPPFLPHVFERFRQADGSTSRVQPGLGLGLAIVRQLVEMHGGTVSASSEGEGQGATFVVSLPVPALRETLQPPAESPRTPVATAKELRAVSLQGLRLLVVDDDADGREAVKTVLEQRGAHVTSAASVAEALAALDSDVPDVLVSDIGMPVRDGYDLIHEVRRRPRARGGEVPALALTAYAATEDRQKTSAAGFQDYLSKPAEPADLVARIALLAQRTEGS